MSTHLWGVVALLATVMVVVMGIIGALLRTSAPAAEAPNFYAMVLATPQTHVWLWVLALLASANLAILVNLAIKKLSENSPRAAFRAVDRPWRQAFFIGRDALGPRYFEPSERPKP